MPSDTALAQALVSATDSDEMIGAENEILERLNVPLEETERGLTKNAVTQIEQFVSRETGKPWTYDELPESILAG